VVGVATRITEDIGVTDTIGTSAGIATIAPKTTTKAPRSLGSRTNEILTATPATTRKMEGGEKERREEIRTNTKKSLTTAPTTIRN
jgi:hypothetical protein